MSKFFFKVCQIKKKRIFALAIHSPICSSHKRTNCVQCTWIHDKKVKYHLHKRKKMRTRLGTMRIVGLFALYSYCDRKSKRKSHVWNAPKFLISENELISTERLRGDLLMANNTKWFFFLYPNYSVCNEYMEIEISWMNHNLW